MKTKYILFAISLLLGLSSCEMRDELKGNSGSGDEGTMQLDMDINDPEIITRAGGFSFPSEEVDLNNYSVKILDASTEAVKKEYTYPQLIAADGKVSLTAGNYTIVGFNYDRSSQGAVERPFFKGETAFQILAGKTTTVNTICSLQDFGAYIVLTDNFKAHFKDDYIITITNLDGSSYAFTQDKLNKVAYFPVPVGKKAIGMLLNATTKEGLAISQSFTINKPGGADVAANEVYKITVDPGENPGVIVETKINWNISVDLLMYETAKIIEIPTENITYNPGGEEPGPGPGENEDAIVVTGLDKTYNITNDDEINDVPTVQVDFSVPNGIQNLFVKIDSDNPVFMGILAGGGLDEQFDMANLNDEQRDFFIGIGLIEEGEVIEGKTEYLFDITEFVSFLKPFVGKHIFTITVSDGETTRDASGAITVNVEGVTGNDE